MLTHKYLYIAYLHQRRSLTAHRKGKKEARLLLHSPSFFAKSLVSLLSQDKARPWTIAQLKTLADINARYMQYHGIDTRRRISHRVTYISLYIKPIYFCVPFSVITMLPCAFVTSMYSRRPIGSNILQFIKSDTTITLP